MGPFKVMFARFPGGNSEHPASSDWVMDSIVKAIADPRIGKGNIKRAWVADTPITMSRNRVVKQALELEMDYLCMIDSDMQPDLPGEDPFAVAGLWRDTPEWGPAYAMVMTEACQHVAGVHDRMPVVLRRDEWADWLDGPPDAAGLLCRPYPGPMAVERTADPWVRR